jgi:hypothetical protein
MRARRRPDEPEPIDKRFKSAVAHQLCAIIDGWTQLDGGAWVGLSQPVISELRSGNYRNVSIARLLRCIAERRSYNVELILRPMERPNALPRQFPTLAVIRYDPFGRKVTMTM